MIFRISNWSVGTKLTLLVLCGFALSFGVSSVHTSQTFGEETRKDLVTQAGAITAQALSTLEYVDELHAQDGIFHDESLVKEAAAAIQGAHTNEEIIARARETKVYKTLPVVAAWQIAQKRASKYGFEFRTPRLEPRNPANRADEIERKLLEELSTGDKTEAWLVDETTQRLHYMQPVRVKASCLACHGRFGRRRTRHVRARHGRRESR
jgi:methyl-accepting chemotaxis protein